MTIIVSNETTNNITTHNKCLLTLAHMIMIMIMIIMVMIIVIHIKVFAISDNDNEYPAALAEALGRAYVFLRTT